MIFGNLVSNMRNQSLVKHYHILSDMYHKYQNMWEETGGKNNFAVNIIDEKSFQIKILGATISVVCYYILPEEKSDILVGKLCFRNGDIRLLTLYFKTDGHLMAESWALHGDLIDTKKINQTFDVLVEKLIETGVFPSDYEVR